MKILTLAIVAFLLAAIPAYGIDVCPNHVYYYGPNDGVITVDVVLSTHAAVDIDAFGFDILYDDALFDFQYIQAGAEYSDWVEFDANIVTEGQLRLGAYNSGSVSVDYESLIVSVAFSFHIEGHGMWEFWTTSFTDDFIGAVDCLAIADCTDAHQLDWGNIKAAY